jgi:hypothetical protein
MKTRQNQTDHYPKQRRYHFLERLSHSLLGFAGAVLLRLPLGTVEAKYL